MKNLLLCIACSIISLNVLAQGAIKATPTSKYALAIHGGAGYINRGMLTPAQDKAYRAALQRSLTVGYNILIRGGSATDAVEACIMVLENDSLFNAGKGAVFNNNGVNELDAAIMDGKTLKAGSVAGVTTVRNPINAARMVMDKSPHVMLAGKGAEAFAAEVGCSMVDPAYFHTTAMWNTYINLKNADSVKNDLHKKKSYLKQPENGDYKYGTVGAVALDLNGNLAAGTSTGGMSNKKYGRIGDSPIIGAGTYADNNTCAISCTGWGEYFIRLVMAKSVADRMELKNMKLVDAANEMIMKKLPELGGDGGLIGLDKDGNIAMPFNTTGMHRAYIKAGGEMVIKLYQGE